jgi:hypothetical protein
MKISVKNNFNADNCENIVNNEFLEHKGFLRNLNSFLYKESQI